MAPATMNGPLKETDSKGILKNAEEKEPLANGKAKEAEEKEGGDDDLDHFNPPDGGWGWVVCLVSFWTNGTVFGILNTFGILYVKMIVEFDNGETDIAFKVSWIGALQITMTFFLSPIASIMVDRLGIRITGFLGATIATIGMLASSFVNTMEVLYVTYGLLLGIGSSLIYNPSLVILGHYFKKRLGIVNGLVSFGSAVFTIVLPFMLKSLLETVDLRNTMRVLAALLAVLIPASLTWRPLFENRHTELDHYLSTDSVPHRVTGCCRWSQKFLNTSIWKVKGYRIWAISLPVAFLGYFIPFVHLVKHTQDVFPDANGEILVMCIGATSGISRLIFGKVADMPRVNRIRMQQAAFLVLGVATACIPFASHFGVLIFITLVMGISDGCFICLLGPIAFDLLGPAGAAQGIGCLLGIASIPMTAGPPLAGLAYDYMRTYQVVFFAAGAPPIIASILLFLIPGQKQTPEAVTMTHTIAAMSRTDLDKVGLDDLDRQSFLRLRYGHLDMRGARSAGTLPNANLNAVRASYTPQGARKTQSVPHLANNQIIDLGFNQPESLAGSEQCIDHTTIDASVV